MREPSIEEKEQIAELTKLFQRLGADEPESWAKSEVMENIPQLARFLFLRAAWKKIISESDTSWMDWEIKYSMRKPNDPCAGIGHSLKSLLELGASREDLTNLVRGMQYKTLFDICYLIDDLNEEIPEFGEFGWALYERDKDGKITGRIVQGMHEDALSMDPTGREMRPRNNENK
jgi:hypothetical protein